MADIQLLCTQCHAVFLVQLSMCFFSVCQVSRPYIKHSESGSTDNLTKWRKSVFPTDFSAEVYRWKCIVCDVFSHCRNESEAGNVVRIIVTMITSVAEIAPWTRS